MTLAGGGYNIIRDSCKLCRRTVRISHTLRVLAGHLCATIHPNHYQISPPKLATVKMASSWPGSPAQSAPAVRGRGHCVWQETAFRVVDECAWREADLRSILRPLQCFLGDIPVLKSLMTNLWVPASLEQRDGPAIARNQLIPCFSFSAASLCIGGADPELDNAPSRR